MSIIETNISQQKTIPQPEGVPLLGNLTELTKGEMFKNFLQLHHEYGDIFYLNLLNKKEMIVIRHPDMMQYVMQTNNRNYTKGEQMDVVRPLAGNGLFLSEGSYWRRQRRMMQPAFHRKQINLLAEVMIQATQEMINRWKQREGTVISLQDEMMAYTMEVVTRTLFTNSMREEEVAELSDTIGFLLKTVTERGERLVDISQHLPTRKNRRFNEGIAQMDALVYRLINERRASNDEHYDLLEMLLSAEDADTHEKMSDKQIRDELITMFLAGHETTAIALSWAFPLLSQNPHVRQKLQEEVDRVLGKRTPTAADFKELVYTTAVFQEALRLYTPLPLTAREAIDDDEIDGYHIPAGSVVMLNFYATHRHQDFWQNPEGFQPERFLPENEKGRHRYAYVPFGGGPRQCIGNNFALMEGTMALAMVTQNFLLDMVPGTELIPNSIGTLRPLSKVPMHLIPR